jgi:membrane protein YdbS with pleckstrin-like domain
VTASGTEPALRAPQYKVSSRAPAYWLVRALLRWLVLIAIELAIWLSQDNPPAGFLIAIVVTAGVAALHLAVMPPWRYRVHRWEDTPSAIYTQSGWLNQERRIAPIARIQTVDTHRGPIEQVFGLANVTVTTASAAGALHIRGLDLAVAERLVADLTERTQATSDDAT